MMFYKKIKKYFSLFNSKYNVCFNVLLFLCKHVWNVLAISEWKWFQCKSCFKVKIKPLHDSEDLEYSAKGIRTLLKKNLQFDKQLYGNEQHSHCLKHFVCNSRKILIIEVCNGIRVNKCSFSLRRLWCHRPSFSYRSAVPRD